MTAEQRAEWRRLADDATSGPWTAFDDDLWFGVTTEELDAFDAGETDWPAGASTLFQGDPVFDVDPPFIAAAREAVPVLLDAIDRVLALHTAVPLITDQSGHAVGDARVCSVCDDGDLWPCRTVRAIEGAS